MHWCSNALVQQCSGAAMHWPSNVLSTSWLLTLLKASYSTVSKEALTMKACSQAIQRKMKEVENQHVHPHLRPHLIHSFWFSLPDCNSFSAVFVLAASCFSLSWKKYILWKLGLILWMILWEQSRKALILVTATEISTVWEEVFGRVQCRIGESLSSANCGGSRGWSEPPHYQTLMCFY